MKVYTARQAVFNRQLKVVAYELLFRDGPTNAFPNIDSDAATSKLIMDSQLNMGIKRITSGKKALINFPKKALIQLLPTLLPPDQIIIEILEDVEPCEEVYEAVRTLFHENYKLALDDYNHDPRWEPYIKLCRLIKFDIIQTPLNTLHELVNEFKKQKNLKLLAEKVETQAEFELAKEMGFDYFQGYFFCKPQIVCQQDIDTNPTLLMMIYNELLKPDLNMNAVSQHLQQDTSLTYKLLRFINSGLFPTKEEISSVKQGLIYLGESQVKKFLLLIVTAHLASNKPAELTRVSVIRARFCENAAKRVAPGITEQVFLMGLFSLLDAILDKPMEDLLPTLPLSEEIKQALLGYDGIYLRILNLIKAYESGSWRAMQKAANVLKLEEADLPMFYAEAINWADILNNCSTEENT